MADLATTYGYLRREVAHYLGFGRDTTIWNVNQIADIETSIDDGLRLAYFPPRLPEERVSHQWTFLQPIGYLELRANQWQVDMPEDYAQIVGNFYYLQPSNAPPYEICLVNEARIFQLRQNAPAVSADPRYAAVSIKRHDAVGTNLYQASFWPSPSATCTLRYKYHIRPPALRNDNELPLGGIEHAQLILSACLAAAENKINDTIDRKHELFMTALRSSIDFDRKANSPRNIGYNAGDSDCDDCCADERFSGLITYAGVPAGDAVPPPVEPPTSSYFATQGGVSIITQAGIVLGPQPEP